MEISDPPYCTDHTELNKPNHRVDSFLRLSTMEDTEGTQGKWMQDFLPFPHNLTVHNSVLTSLETLC